MRSIFSSRRASRQPRCYRPCLETLENRLALATHIWNGANSNLWSDSANWTGGSPAGDPQAILSFPNAAANFANQNDLVGLTVAEIDFTGGNYTLSGNPITLVAGSLGFPRFHMDAIDKNNSIAFALSRVATNIDISLDIANRSTLTVTGVIDGGAAATNIIKSGPGILVLGGENTFADGVLIIGGVLQIQNSSALGTPLTGDTNRTTVSGGTLALNGNLQVADSFSVGAAGGFLSNVSGNSNWAGKVFLASTDLSTSVFSGSLTISGEISDNPAGPARGIIKSGSGTLLFTSANTYRGATTVNEGKLNISNASALGTADAGTTISFFATLELEGPIIVGMEPLTLRRANLISVDGNNTWQGPITLDNSPTMRVVAGTLTLSGAITGSTPDLTVDGGGGKLIFSNANSYTGSTRIRNGAVLNIRHPQALGLANFLSIFDVGSTLELELQGANSINKAADIEVGSILRNVSGTNTWTGAVRLFADPTPNVTVDVSGGQLTISGLISQAGSINNSKHGITKFGDGPLFLTANNTYPGDTVVNAGSLFVNGTIPGSVVMNAGTLAGAGSVAAITANGGVVSPGVGIGRLTANGNATFATSTRFEVDLNGTTAGTSYDQFKVNGTVNLSNSTLIARLNFFAATSVSFRIIDNVGTLPVGGTFAGLPEDATLPSGNLRITYRGGDGNDVVVTRIITISTSPFNTISRFPDRSVTPVLEEGGVATLTGTISDPDPHDVFFLKVNWGDGTPTELHVFPPGSDGKQVQLTHRYADDNPSGTLKDNYTIQLSWHDKAREGNSATLTTAVRNVAPVLKSVGTVKLTPSRLLSQLVKFTDPGRDSWTATVDFGDGSKQKTINLHSRNQFVISHRYGQAGAYTVTVTVKDDDDGVDTTSFQVMTANQSTTAARDAFFALLDNAPQANRKLR